MWFNFCTSYGLFWSLYFSCLYPKALLDITYKFTHLLFFLDDNNSLLWSYDIILRKCSDRALAPRKIFGSILFGLFNSLFFFSCILCTVFSLVYYPKFAMFCSWWILRFAPWRYQPRPTEEYTCKDHDYCVLVRCHQDDPRTPTATSATLIYSAGTQEFPFRTYCPPIYPETSS